MTLIFYTSYGNVCVSISAFLSGLDAWHPHHFTSSPLATQAIPGGNVSGSEFDLIVQGLEEELKAEPEEGLTASGALVAVVLVLLVMSGWAALLIWVKPSFWNGVVLFVVGDLLSCGVSIAGLGAYRRLLVPRAMRRAASGLTTPVIR